MGIFVRLERLSHRTIIIASLCALAALSVTHTIVAKLQFRDAAINYRVVSLARVVEVAALEVLRQTRHRAVEFGYTLQADIASALNRIPNDPAALSSLLDDPFIKGFVGAGQLELVKLRVYDPDLRLVAQSNKGRTDLAPHLPRFIERQARERTGPDRLKAAGALWVTPQEPLFSVLVPVGGLRVRGYLEVVVAPVFNLRQVGAMIQMPFGIHAADGAELFHPESIHADDPRYLPVEYLLRCDDDTPALRLIAYEDLQLLSSDLHRSQLWSTTGFLLATALLLGAVLWLLHRHLFRPVHAMIARMESCIDGNLEVTLDERGIKEVHRVARAFNVLLAKVHDSLRDLQRLSALDGLTGIANRRHFDSALEREWRQAVRDDSSIALLLADIDFFKQYNDANGHQAGDQCLKEVARALGEAAHRPGDLVARYGGEEFVVLLTQTDGIGAAVVAQRIQERVAQLAIPHPDSAVSGHVTLSVGVCSVRPAQGMDSHLLVAAADAALYRAKRHGRNRIELALQEELAGPAASIH